MLGIVYLMQNGTSIHDFTMDATLKPLPDSLQNCLQDLYGSWECFSLIKSTEPGLSTVSKQMENFLIPLTPQFTDLPKKASFLLHTFFFTIVRFVHVDNTSKPSKRISVWHCRKYIDNDCIRDHHNMDLIRARQDIEKT